MNNILSKNNVITQRPQAVMLSLQQAQITLLNIVSNNLSNASTVGFKAHIPIVEETIHQSREGRNVSFVKSPGIVRDTSNGPLKLTGNPFDIALNGTGYLSVQKPSGEKFYTRAGQFSTDDTGRLIMANSGYAVTDSGENEIKIPKNTKNFVIREDGTIIADGNAIAKLGLFDFEDELSLSSQGDTLLKAKGEGKVAQHIRVIQGSVEESNISPIKETILMMEILRLFENAQKVIDEYEQHQKKTINLVVRGA